MGYCGTGTPDTFFWLSLFLSLGVALTLCLGILFSPVGALVCELRARRRGLKAWRYAGLGAVHSMLFFLPWVYTVTRLGGWHPPRKLITTVYVILYIAWFVGPIACTWLLLCVGWERDSLFWRFRGAIGVMSFVQLATWFGSMIWIRDQRCGVLFKALPRLEYIQPFGLLAFWTTLLTAVSLGSIG